MTSTLRLAASLAFAASLPTLAATSGVTPSGFLVTHRVETEAAPETVFATIGQPSRWWSAQHTWSGNAGNLRMRLAAQGCFCEAWERNSVEHARVVAMQPPKHLRLEGALGPLQEMAVTGILDFRLEPRRAGTTLTVTYRVRGSADAALDRIAPAVDKVIGEQVQRLAAVVDEPPPGAKPVAFEERYLESEGARLRYLEGGNGEPVILLHDAGATIESQWIDTRVARAIASQYRVIAFDARTPEDVLRLMDRLGIAKAHVAGYGVGAQRAARFAVDHPDRVQTLALAGATPTSRDAPGEAAVPEAAMVSLAVPTLAIVGTRDPAMGDFVALKRVMPRLVRMVAIDGATHEEAPASPDFAIALAYFLRYNPIAVQR
jgi:uncharacterized protein YndB with AHSA1/START domain